MIHRDIYWSQAQDAARHLERSGFGAIDVVVQCGSGLAELAGILRSGGVSVPMDEIPHLPTVTVTGHGREAVYGRIGDSGVLVLTGRIHIYEGHDPLTAGFPAALAKAAGAKLLVITNAAGGLNQHYREGDMMVHRDFINFQHDNAIAHLQADTSAERYVDPKPPYHLKASELAAQALVRSKLGVHYGVYIGVQGPIFETRAELAMMRSFGADAIGMSTIPEVTVAAFFKLPVVGISTITNECFGTTGTDHKEVLAVSSRVAPKLSSGLTLFLEEGQWGEVL
jgi:purine-nucleoside phosphorylase